MVDRSPNRRKLLVIKLFGDADTLLMSTLFRTPSSYKVSCFRKKKKKKSLSQHAHIMLMLMVVFFANMKFQGEQRNHTKEISYNVNAYRHAQVSYDASGWVAID